MSELKLQTSQAYFRDKFVPFDQANLSIASSPMLYGLSVYTVVAANWDATATDRAGQTTGQLHLFRLRDHWQRLVNSARIIDFADFASVMPYDKFAQIITELVTTNDVRQDALIRATIFIDELVAGTKIRGLTNSFCAFVYPMGEILPRDGIHCCISSWTRTADNMIPARAKINGSYVNSSLMKNEALTNGYDDAIALDNNGHVTEGTVSNLFVVRGGQLITPDHSADILEGITRDSILRLAAELGLPCATRSLDRSELYIADEAFMVGSSARIIPILSIDRRPISAAIGPITQQLRDEYAKIQLGQSDTFGDWLTAVY